ncbi:restriction endonuclease [Granulicella sp. WH15]|uniref:restriction endonuclease n=1 Tax=Granulicella sp. WH15 TaxID=2602070 RepID=UPI001366AFBC|nr:restriction endonuclease [Granulicella sp. WH15]QHN04778.1 restriction endonuclease [Granulicella sp. WH15]
MIEIRGEGDDLAVYVADKEVEILDAGGEHILAECSLEDLTGEQAQPFPDELELEIRSENGFGTYLFHEAHLSATLDGVALSFHCHTPNKYWEGQYGLATYLAAIRDELSYRENWEVVQIELEDDWKSITVERTLALGDPLGASILAAAGDLKGVLHAAEVSLSGLPWSDEYLTDEDRFCRELLHPLLRRIGFLFVRYTHGSREYGKDFTFSESTLFGHYRHYGLQAKAGDVSGGVNAAIDELLGQISDAFAMPYYELGLKEPRYISTFVIAISGRFTANAKEKIAEKMPRGIWGSVYFLDGESITELVERYWKATDRKGT